MSDELLQQQIDLRQKILQGKHKIERNLNNLELYENEIHQEIEKVSREKKKYCEWAKYFGDDLKSEEVLHWFDAELKKLELKIERLHLTRDKLLSVQDKISRQHVIVNQKIEKLKSSKYQSISHPKTSDTDKLPVSTEIGIRRSILPEEKKEATPYSIDKKSLLEKTIDPALQPDGKQKPHDDIEKSKAAQSEKSPFNQLSSRVESINDKKSTLNLERENPNSSFDTEFDSLFGDAKLSLSERPSISAKADHLAGNHPEKAELDERITFDSKQSNRSQNLSDLQLIEDKKQSYIKKQPIVDKYKSNISKKLTISKAYESTVLDSAIDDRASIIGSELEARTLSPKSKVAEIKSTISQSQISSDILYLGIDLGTYQTTVSSSNGHEITIMSAVGWTKDMVLRKMLKKDILFGEEALRNKLALNLYRPLEKGVIKNTDEDLRAARELIKYAIAQVGPFKYKKVYAVIGVPSQASLMNEQAIIDAAREIVNAVTIVSEPFAVAYGEANIYNTLIIDIGAGTIDICCLKGTMPQKEDQITLEKAGDYIDYQLQDFIKSHIHGAQVTKDVARKWKETYSFVMKPEAPVIVDVAVEGKPLKINVTRLIQRSCESIVDDIVKSVKQLISSFDPEFHTALKENIILAGGGSLIRNLDTYLIHKLSSLGTVKIKRIKNPIVAGARGALALAQDVTDDFWRGF